MTEAVERFIAWHLPKRVVYWCVVRAQGKGFAWPLPVARKPFVVESATPHLAA